MMVYIKMDNRLIVAFIVATIIMMFYVSYRKEGFTDGSTWIESILNSLGAMEAKLSDRNIAADNVSATNHLKGGTLTLAPGTENQAHIEGTNFHFPVGTMDIMSMKAKDKVFINGTQIDGWGIRQMKNLQNVAGYGIDGDGSTHLLFQGTWNLTDQFRWANDKWDDLIIFKGWRITVFENGDGTGWSKPYENLTDNVMVINLEKDGLQNKVSSYTAEWLDYDKDIAT